MNRGALGARALNLELQRLLNPPGEARIERFGWVFSPGDKVMQVFNEYGGYPRPAAGGAGGLAQGGGHGRPRRSGGPALVEAAGVAGGEVRGWRGNRMSLPSFAAVMTGSTRSTSAMIESRPVGQRARKAFPKPALAGLACHGAVANTRADYEGCKYERLVRCRHQDRAQGGSGDRRCRGRADRRA
jgi:hypothetical protein